ncbi:MAG: peptide ABC transporter substrate-binding protein [Chlamydiia bacterium]|nr:peptide ABC transporter substrate-binding protein [Chlamydiia bacterium]
MKNILLAFAWIFVVSACQKQLPSPHNNPKTTLRMCMNTDPATLDPRRNADPWSSTLNFLLYEGLTRILPNGEAEPSLAQSIEISDDGRTYLFHLKKTYWSDGAPLTAHDFEYSWKTTLDPKFGAACPYLFYPIKNAERAIKKEVSANDVGIWALDDLTLKVELQNPTPYFLSLVTFCNFFPIPKHIAIKNPNWESTEAQELIFSGPYKIKRWVRNKELILEKNPSHWNAKEIQLNGIRINVTPDERTALRLFENHEVDYISTIIMPLSLDDLAHLKKTNQLILTPVGGLFFCSFNVDCYPFHNAHIRTALAYAIDRAQIAHNITQLSEPAATRIIPPVLMGNKDRKLIPEYDPHAAQIHLNKGLEELGISLEEFSACSQALILSYRSSDLYRRIAQAIQHDWKKVLGIEVALEELEFKSFMQNLMNRKFSIGLENAVAQYADPNNILERFKYKENKKNYPGYENPEFIALLNKADMTTDPELRLKVLEEAEALLAADMPLTPIYHFQQGVLMSPAFANVQFSPLFNLLFTKLIPIDTLHDTSN